ncbi:MAG TPA: diacylglycerol kinase family protein [Gemmatimonadales bacterium]
MARAVLITNPAAARTTQGAVEAVRDQLRTAGWQLDVVATVGPGDARRLSEEAVRQGMELVVVQGGDGTTMQAAAALVGTDVALGLIPGGTGNLLAGNLRIPKSVLRAAGVLARGHRRRIDLGKMVREDGLHYFSVAAGTGMDARIMAETASDEKRRWGIGAYMATTLRILPEMRSVHFHITVDGVEYDANAAVILVANCGEVIPPFLKLGHGITPDDGLLDVVVIRGDGIVDTMRAVWHVLWDLPPERAGGSFIGYARGRIIRIESDVEQPVEMDGDAAGRTPFTAEIVPGAIQVIVPH